MEDAPKPGSSEAVVEFTTKLPEEYRVPEDQLVVPNVLARYGLSEVVNRLLSLESPVPFDFLVDGEFLRTTVAGYMEANKLSSEKVLRLEYVFALSEPEQSEVDQVPDWIAGLATLQDLPSALFAAVSYDGTARIYSGGRAQTTLRLSDLALTSIAALPVAGGSHLVAGGKDGCVRCCALRHGTKGESEVVVGPVATLRPPGTARAVEAVAVSEDGTLLGTAGWGSGEISIWNADDSLFASPSDAGAGAKRKASENGEPKHPKFSLKGHSQVATCLHFGASARYPFTLLSGSWDSSVRVWDLAAASPVCNWTVARAVTSFSMSPVMPPQIATAHEDGHVSLWDIRAPPHPAVQGAVSLDASAGLPLASAQAPHRRLVAQVAWCPEDANRIASVGHDGNMCILDPRSPKMPLTSLRLGRTGSVPTKLLCLTWLGRDGLAVGGSDGKVVQVNLRPGAAAAADAGA